MDTFILRIYRQTDNDITGRAEHVESGRNQRFQDLDELLEIIKNSGYDTQKTKKDILKKATKIDINKRNIGN